MARGGRRVLLPLLGVALVLAAGAGAFLALSGREGGRDGDGDVAATATTAPPPDSRAPRVANRSRIGFRGNGVAVAGGSVWVTGFTQTQLHRADPGTGRRTGSVPVPAGAADVVASGNAVWIAVSESGRVLKVDARTGEVRAQLQTRDQPVALAVDGRTLWVAGLTRTAGQPDSLTRFDIATGRQLGIVDVPDGARAIAVGGGAVWVVGRRGNRVLKLSRGGQLQKTIQSVGAKPADIAYGSGAVWVTTLVDNSLVRIDPKTGDVGAVPAGITPEAVEFRDGRLWVASRGDSTLRQYRAGRVPQPVGEPLQVDLNPVALAVTDDSVWVSCVGSTSLVRVAIRSR